MRTPLAAILSTGLLALPAHAGVFTATGHVELWGLPRGFTAVYASGVGGDSGNLGILTKDDLQALYGLDKIGIVSGSGFIWDNTSGFGPGVTTVGGLDGEDGAQSISAAFASMLTGSSVAEQAFLSFETYDLGNGFVPRLVLRSATGQSLGAADLVLTGYTQFFSATNAASSWSVAVDEASGVIYVGDTGMHGVMAIGVPAPAGAAALAGAAGLIAVRRRRTR